MWSAGVVLYAMLYGNVPFKGADMKDLHKQIIEANYELKDEISVGKWPLNLSCMKVNFLICRGKRPNQRTANEESQVETNSRPGSQAHLVIQSRDPE